MENTALWDAILDAFPEAPDNDRVIIYGIMQDRINMATQAIFEQTQADYENGTI